MILASKKGFGLIEVLIAVTILTIIGLGFSQSMNFQIQGQSAVTANGEMANLQQVLAFAISDYPTCHAQALVGMAFNPVLPAAVPVPGGTLKYTSGLPIVSIGTNLGDGLIVQKIQIQPPFSKVSPTTFIIQLQVTAQKKAGTVTGSNVFTASVPVSVQAIVAGLATIKDCTTGAVCTPPVWSPVGFGSESFCINTALQPPAFLFKAAANCEALDAHLCSSSEWLEACNFAGGGFDATTTQWIAPIYTGCGSPGCYALATNSGYPGQCMIGGNIGGDGNNKFHNYRCCHR